ncbi:protein-glutamine gamma-glutamyltransferase 6 [Mugil cephalus]|uniref:protein-glutamine gamma-glutamyltransferase 6 n=1 Tax=Mugil cephalus TaxID=48193 RepID=UPI001FB5BE18|nr:protein-glutamine gamma-glutamyltransferase 6 [Mugil cephalus]
MTANAKPSFFVGVDLHCVTNNTQHRTSKLSQDQLIVRRGQSFILTLKLKESFNPELHLFTFTASTGEHPSENIGTMSRFGLPDFVRRSQSAKAVWKASFQTSTPGRTGSVTLLITPPADAPVGKYVLSVKHKDDEILLKNMVVLFNPWCPDDWVSLADEEQRQEYVMNEQGIIYKGSGSYITPMSWDYAQFESDMVEICLKLLDLNHKHLRDPADDVSARCNPIYVSRVISAMINTQDDSGVVEGRWSGSYFGGKLPSHWSGSHAILKRWYDSGCHPVKYGQCWVFAGVMCSVMRLLGIPCRVVTNYHSAHDNNKNLIIDVYHADYGVREKESNDSIWNYHVWVEGWMRRPDLAKDGKYDGWQVVDPTPQEKSDGVYCCGPAPVSAVLNGETHLKYDVPFVFAEVNADCIDWMIKADGSKVKIYSDTTRVGHNISTKAVGSNRRVDITNTYKYAEGTEKERTVFKYALTRVHTSDMVESINNGEVNGSAGADDQYGGEGVNKLTEDTEEVVPEIVVPLPPVTIRFQEVSKLINTEDVKLNLLLSSESKAPRPVSVNVSVQAMRYNRSPAANIQTNTREETLQPGKELCIPILVPFSAYHKHMVECESMTISALVTDKQKPNNTYLGVKDVVLKNPSMSINVSTWNKIYCESTVEVVFTNPINQVLKECTLTLSGSGLFQDEMQYTLPDLKPNTRVRIQLPFTPYKSGERTLLADFDCSAFRDIKASCVVNVRI